MALGIPASVLGFIVSGDVSGYTIYTDRHGRKIAFPVAPPKKPPSARQMYQRQRFRSAQAEYMALSALDRSRWEQLTLLTSIAMTGQNLFIHTAMKHSSAALDTLMRQTGVTVAQPTPV